jgi:hypothetical protein
MERVRNVRLDNLCESIAEERRAINDATVEVKGLSITALREMREKRLTSHRHAGVELIRIPGEERLSIRTSKAADATAETEPEETDVDGEEAGEETGPAEPAVEATELQEQ